MKKLPKYIRKSIRISYQLLPQEYDNRQGYRTYHWSFIWRRNHLLSIGNNDVLQPSAKAKKVLEQFGCSTEFIFIHSEIDAIQKLLGRTRINSSLNIVNLRLNRYMELKQSTPCERCETVLKALNFGKIWFSNKKGEIELMK